VYHAANLAIILKLMATFKKSLTYGFSWIFELRIGRKASLLARQGFFNVG
jgi:hypothetical protein